MSYIDKEKLIKADIASIENRVRHAFNQGYDLGYKEGKANCSEIPTDLGVKLISKSEVDRIIDCPYFRLDDKLIQIMHLPSLTFKEHILDKLRAKIDKIYEREGNSVDCLNALDELKLFIDKCNAESEAK